MMAGLFLHTTWKTRADEPEVRETEGRLLTPPLIVTSPLPLAEFRPLPHSHLSSAPPTECRSLGRCRALRCAGTPASLGSLHTASGRRVLLTPYRASPVTWTSEASGTTLCSTSKWERLVGAGIPT